MAKETAEEEKKTPEQAGVVPGAVKETSATGKTPEQADVASGESTPTGEERKPPEQAGVVPGAAGQSTTTEEATEEAMEEESEGTGCDHTSTSEPGGHKNS